MTAPTSREGVARFLADYRTRYRVKIPAGSDWVSHPTLPPFEHLSLAEIEAAKLAGPTRVDVERSGPVHNHGSEEGDGLGCRESIVDGRLVGACLTAPKFCQCGHPEDEHYLGSVCTKIEGMYVCGCEHFVEEAA